ncbi:hypothetical protein CRG98_009844 [Punica granatum]|uniref:Uncharacterized protein n=1 Tax=Punica granatum TaxID=22663 RepID=A0A2I0KMI3_PUNGR|nr:hypothetical protein CRG98_009844 [Punica granatum]
MTSQREKEKAYQFLRGVNLESSTMCSNILNLDPFPALNKVYAVMIHYERQKIAAHGHESGLEAAVYYVKVGAGIHPNSRSGSCHIVTAMMELLTPVAPAGSCMTNRLIGSPRARARLVRSNSRGKAHLELMGHEALRPALMLSRPLQLGGPSKYRSYLQPSSRSC